MVEVPGLALAATSLKWTGAHALGPLAFRATLLQFHSFISPCFGLIYSFIYSILVSVSFIYLILVSVSFIDSLFQSD